MLRLTLRTLLAYLDDTLDPAQTKDIGKKVAQSEFAQETVERIKTVTRRRRLTAPPLLADDHSADPNSIAEYLDNMLPADQVTELEKTALESDVRLAEVAACHQILTLVLGEPALIPPTARRRMYRLVTGPESLPYRQPAANTPIAGIAAPAEVDEFHDHDDDLLTTFLGPQKFLWILSLGIAVTLLVVAIWLAIPPTPSQPNQGYIALASNRPSPKPIEVVKKPDTGIGEIPDPPNLPKMPIVPELGPPPRELAVGPPPVKPPDSERRVVAVLDSPEQPLLFEKRDTSRWEKADAQQGRLFSLDSLLALPGFHPELQLPSGVHIEMWGNVPEFLPLPLAETRLALAVPASGIDADFTLYSGRVFLSAPKSMRPVVVRLRFRNEVWDITLATPATEVAIDLIGEPAKGPLFNRELPESPRALLYVQVLRGLASISSGFQATGDLLPGAKWKWDSKVGRPAPAPKDDPDELGVVDRWSKLVPATPAGKELAASVAEMIRRVGDNPGPFDVEFNATMKDQSEALDRRVLATWMLASVDSLPYLIDALEVDSTPVRAAAARSLRHWIAQDPSREKLFQEELGMKVTMTENERANVAGLVFGIANPVPAESMDRLFELLANEKLAVRELARLQLATIDPAGFKDSNYDAMSDRRAAQIALWKANWKRKMKGKE